MNEAVRSCVIRLTESQADIPGPAGEHSVRFLQRGTLDVRLALAPTVPPTEQTAHAQDEIYVIVRGRGTLLHDGKRDSFVSGDFLFVAAGTKHRFENFTDDLAVWVIFHGPRGGEIPSGDPTA